MKSSNFFLSLWHSAKRIGVNKTNALGHMFVSRLCHSGQTHRFRRCSSAAVGALEYPKTNFRKSNKEKLYYTLLLLFSVGCVVVLMKVKLNLRVEGVNTHEQLWSI